MGLGEIRQGVFPFLQEVITQAVVLGFQGLMQTLGQVAGPLDGLVQFHVTPILKKWTMNDLPGHVGRVGRFQLLPGHLLDSPANHQARVGGLDLWRLGGPFQAGSAARLQAKV